MATIEAKWRYLLIFVGIAAAVAAYWAGCAKWRSGTVLLVSQNKDIFRRPTIRIRELPADAPWLGLLAAGSLDNYVYRCEYYNDSSNTLFSCITYDENRGYPAGNPNVIWEPGGVAVVSLSGSKLFRCEPNGFWLPVGK
jgi:hypothetical protein